MIANSTRLAKNTRQRIQPAGGIAFVTPGIARRGGGVGRLKSGDVPLLL